MNETLADIFRGIRPPIHTFDLSIGAEFFEWLEGYSDPAVAWAECERGDWLLWSLIVSGTGRQAVCQAAAECALRRLPVMEAAPGRVVVADRLIMTDRHEDMPRLVLQDVADWSRGMIEFRGSMVQAQVLSRIPSENYSTAATAAECAYSAASGDVRHALRCALVDGDADVIRRRFPDPPAIFGPNGVRLARRWAELAPTDTEEDREWWWRLSAWGAQPEHGSDDLCHVADVFRAPNGDGVNVFLGSDGTLYASRGRQFVPLMDREAMRDLAVSATSGLDVPEEDRENACHDNFFPLARAPVVGLAAK